MSIYNTPSAVNGDASIQRATHAENRSNDHNEDGDEEFIHEAPDIFNASSVAEIKATLSHLHEREATVTARLDALVASQKDFFRQLARLDLLRAHLGSQATTTRSIHNGMLSSAASTADRISSAVKRLDLEQARVKATLDVVEHVAELKACVLGVAGSMGDPQDWEMAASYLNRASKIAPEIVNGSFAGQIVPTAEVPDPPNVTLENAAESLCGLFLREFEKAVKESDGAKITRFFKLFPLIGRSEVGLDVYGRYVCQGVAGRARTNLNTGTGSSQSKDSFFYANALTKLFEHIAQIVDGHGGLVERHYGQGKMIRVVERLQVEADVQGGIILETWGEERAIDRKLTDIKSYAFTFLVQSFLPGPRPGGTPRSGSPGLPRNSEDEGVDMKEIDAVLNEMAVMLGRWSLYSRFLAEKCKDPETINKDSDSEGSALPGFVLDSTLARKVGDRLINPFNAMTTFFLRRSLEKAFQLDEQPTDLTLNPRKPLGSNPPHITSAVDDIMYIVNKILQQSLATSQRAVVVSVVPTLARVLGSDFIGMIQRKMWDETYPKAAIQGGQPPEHLVVAFLVLVNNLDVAIDYIHRIVRGHIVVPSSEPSVNGDEEPSHLQSLFPLADDAKDVLSALQSFSASFEAKASDLLGDAIPVVFNNVIKHRLRPILQDTFRDIDYEPDEHQPDHAEEEEDFSSGELVKHRFAAAWQELLLPVSRILTASAFDRLLTITLSYLSRLLEKRLWSYHGRVNALGTTRLERDISGIVSAAVDIGSAGSGGASGVRGGGGRYRLREAFAKCLQITLVMSMEEDEWEDAVRGFNGAADVLDKLTYEERVRARAMVR